ncbi:MAG: hypothetical protein AAB966_02785 [Patescibacteria group bacterium]
MEKITGFLDRISKIQPPDFAVRNSMTEIIKEVLDEDVSIKDISVRNQIVHINGNSSFRNTLVLNKDKILKKLQEKLPGEFVKDIN